MPEGQVTDAELARIKRGFELYNEGDYDALTDFISPDVVMERVGEQEPVHGWEAFREFQNPVAFAWQRLEPIEWTVHGDKVLIRMRVRAQGAASGVELDMPGWMVCTIRDGLAVRIQNFTDEPDARAAAGL